MGTAAEPRDARRGADWHPRRPALPRCPDDVDAGWLTQVLAPSAPPGARIVHLTVSDVGTGMGLLGRLLRYDLAWDGGHGPSSVVVKLPAEGARSRALAVGMAMYLREVGFYRDLGAASDVAVRCHHADVDEQTQDFVLVLDDLTAAATIDQLAGCPIDRAAEVLTAVAGIHARHWDDAGLEAAPHQQRFGGSLFAEQLARSVDACWPDVRAAVGDELSPLAVAIGDGLARSLPRVTEALSRPPITLSHGDLRLDNVFFDEAAGVRLCDWQLSGGLGAPATWRTSSPRASPPSCGATPRATSCSGTSTSSPPAASATTSPRPGPTTAPARSSGSRTRSWRSPRSTRTTPAAPPCPARCSIDRRWR